MTRDCGEFALAGPTSESDGTGEVDVPADHDPKTGPGRLWPSNGVLSIPIGASKAVYDRPPSRASRQHGRHGERRRVVIDGGRFGRLIRPLRLRRLGLRA
jgi:hypothetical protein